MNLLVYLVSIWILDLNVLKIERICPENNLGSLNINSALAMCACTSTCQLSWLADGMLPAPQDSSVLLLALFIYSRWREGSECVIVLPYFSSLPEELSIFCFSVTYFWDLCVYKCNVLMLLSMIYLKLELELQCYKPIIMFFWRHEGGKLKASWIT